MTEAIVAILGISLLLYVLLGGADFGAGIVEMIVGKKSSRIVSKAIAPVWEANHIWLILAVVILFNGFPLAYTTITTYLHIPLLLAMIGIIIRGAAFSFRYYDVVEGHVQNYYSWSFRLSSLMTPFFLGIVLGAIILGRIPVNPSGSFNDIFISPWLNGFAISTGIFMILLFGWIASVYLIGESDDESFPVFRRTSLILFIAVILCGGVVFLMAHHWGVHLFSGFLHSVISISCIVVATLLVPVMWISINRKKALLTRIIAGAITACILAGWFAVQFPVLVNRRDGAHLTIWNTQAPSVTMYYLLAALVVGIFIIFPAFGYLFRIFKFSREST
jgi:cytochrome d ubiquinol oxidase subunit II